MGLALEWGEITFNCRVGGEKLLVNTSPIPAALLTLDFRAAVLVPNQVINIAD